MKQRRLVYIFVWEVLQKYLFGVPSLPSAISWISLDLESVAAAIERTNERTNEGVGMRKETNKNADYGTVFIFFDSHTLLRRNVVTERFEEKKKTTSFHDAAAAPLSTQPFHSRVLHTTGSAGGGGPAHTHAQGNGNGASVQFHLSTPEIGSGTPC